MAVFKGGSQIAKGTHAATESFHPLTLSQPSRTLLTRVVVAGTALVVSVSAFFSYQTVRATVLDILRQDALSKVGHDTDEVDNWLATLRARVDMLAHTAQVRSVDWSVAGSYLKAEDNRLQDFSALVLATPDGWRNSTATNQRTDVSDRQWFQKAMAGKNNVDDPVISRATGVPVIAVSAPIYSDENSTNSPIGVICGSVDVDRVAYVVNRLNYGEGSYAFALNSEGRAIVHPNPALMSSLEKPAPSLLQSSDPTLASIAQQMVARKRDIQLTQLNNQQFYVAFVPLDNANWSIALVIPRENIESRLHLLDGIAAAVVGLTAMLIVVLAWVQSAEQARLKRAKTEAEAINQLLENKVAERTYELEEARDHLEQRVIERTQELQEALQHLTQTQSQLVQTEKMSSLGQLVAGIAHEINNPVNFIHGNVSHVDDYITDLLSLINLYQQKYPNADLEIEQAIADIDLEFIEADLPKTLASMNMGTQRIREIIQSLRTFSRMDEAELKPVDLHPGIDSTLLILQHRLKAKPEHPRIEVIKNYGDLPLVECYAGQLNQVFMNILANAIDALEEQNRFYKENSNNPSRITITTTIDTQEQVKIVIADNGPGIPEAVKEKIFDPFFTTKPMGKGTGMGMSISYEIITEKHNGVLKCNSTPGKGTEFIIQIPIKQRILEAA